MALTMIMIMLMTMKDFRTIFRTEMFIHFEINY